MMSTRRLLQLLSEGDKKSWESLFGMYWEKVCRYLVKILEDDAAAEDLAQNVFVKLWNTRSSLSGIKSLDAFIFSISHNVACDALRRKRTIRKMKENREILTEEPICGIQCNFDAELINETVTRCIEDMPQQQRICYTMSRVEHLTNQEIAERLGLSKRTVEHHIAFALKGIRKALGITIS